jgi:hypothetical protein
VAGARLSVRPGDRYALVVHRRDNLARTATYEPPALAVGVPTVSEVTYRRIGSWAFNYLDTSDTSRFYADFGGGRQHRITTDELTLTINGKWIDATSTHTAQGDGKQVIADMTPVLRWAAEHTSELDRCELVPAPPADARVRHIGPVQIRHAPNGAVMVMCPYGHLVTTVRRGEWAGSRLEALASFGWVVNCTWLYG